VARATQPDPEDDREHRGSDEEHGIHDEDPDRPLEHSDQSSPFAAHAVGRSCPVVDILPPSAKKRQRRLPRMAAAP
jgi:hypothetical protein